MNYSLHTTVPDLSNHDGSNVENFKGAEKTLSKEMCDNHLITKATTLKFSAQSDLHQEQRINLAAIEILEQLGTPQPSELQINQLESTICQILQYFIINPAPRKVKHIRLDSLHSAI